MNTESLMEQYNLMKREKEFIQNWLCDLLDAVQTGCDRETAVRLFEACGRGCYRRFDFKQQISLSGSGSLKNLIAAYKNNFEIWQDEEGVHIRYGEISSGCYCPVARIRPEQDGDLHCECSRSTHQTIFEKALGQPVSIEIIESVRRGGRTCHFLAHV